MRVLNFGSLNIDYVYFVPHFAKPGETIAALSRDVFMGGKGLNQSIALARAGVPIYHAGCVGQDSEMLLKSLEDAGADCRFIYKEEASNGHTIIHVDESGQNCITLYAGTNKMISQSHIDYTMSFFEPGDMIILQNEINNLNYIIDLAYEKGLQIVLNPSPIDDAMNALDLDKVTYLILNEIEAAYIVNSEEAEEWIPLLAKRFPNMKIVLTLGKEGAMFYDGKEIFSQPSFDAKVVDTTGAGDTFLGYFVYGVIRGLPASEILKIASKAASICVSKKGASQSIPCFDEVSNEE